MTQTLTDNGGTGEIKKTAVSVKGEPIQEYTAKRKAGENIKFTGGGTAENPEVDVKCTLDISGKANIIKYPPVTESIFDFLHRVVGYERSTKVGDTISIIPTDADAQEIWSRYSGGGRRVTVNIGQDLSACCRV